MKKFSLLFFLTLIFATVGFAQASHSAVLAVSVSADVGAVGAGTERARIAGVSNSPEAAPSALFAVEKKTFQLINAERTRRGLRTLAWSDDAAKLARMHSQSMAQYHFFSHKGLDGSMVNDRAEKQGIFNWRAIGENIAFNRGYDDPIGMAVEKWLESPSHKENMLNPDWLESGMGVAIAADGSYYFTQVFLLRK